MSSNIGGDFDFLLKLVVIGGKGSLMKIRESEKQTYFLDSLQINLVMNPNQLSAYNSQPVAWISTAQKSKPKSGTQPVKNVSVLLPTHTTKAQQAPCWSLISQEDPHMII